MRPLKCQSWKRKSFLTYYFIVFVLHSEFFWHIMQFKHSSNLSNLSYKPILFCNVSFGFPVVIFTLIPCFYLFFFWNPISCHLKTLTISITLFESLYMTAPISGYPITLSLLPSQSFDFSIFFLSILVIFTCLC